jgi:hypothetical protein
MKRSLPASLSLLWCAAALAAGLPNIKPLVDHLRTLPAEVRGEVFVKSRVPIVDNNEARVSLRPDRNISFGFDEDEVNVNLTGALNMCVKTALDLVDGCLQVDVQHVSWTAEKGFEAQLEMASYDVFGAFASGTKEALEKTLNDRFGTKMKQASAQVKKFRQSKDLGEAQQVAQAIGSVFADGSSAGPAVDFGGRVGLSFRQPTPNPVIGKDHPVQIGDYRIGIKHGDTIDASASFFKNSDGLHIQRFELSSQEGINLSEGTEYEPDMRIILHKLALDADGSDVSLHLGASETIAGLAALLEIVNQGAGAPPSQTCALCEIAELPQFTSEADLSMRQAVFNLVRDNRAALLEYGVSANTLDLFFQRETCKIAAMTCQQPCDVASSREQCVTSCAETYRTCNVRQ